MRQSLKSTTTYCFLSAPYPLSLHYSPLMASHIPLCPCTTYYLPLLVTCHLSPCLTTNPFMNCYISQCPYTTHPLLPATYPIWGLIIYSPTQTILWSVTYPHVPTLLAPYDYCLFHNPICLHCSPPHGLSHTRMSQY